MDPPEFHTEESEEKEQNLSLESNYVYRRNSFQESFTPETQQEEGAVDDACQKLTVQEIESESPADEETQKEHQVPEDALEKQQEEKENEGEENTDKSEKGVEEPPAPSQKEDEAEQSDDEEVSEGR